MKKSGTEAARSYYERNREMVIARATANNRNDPVRRKAVYDAYRIRNRERIKAAANAAYRRLPPGKLREKRLLALYRMTNEDFDRRVAEQGGMCAICRQTRVLHVDHDHVTGVVRGLLCFKCNAGIGQLGDNVVTLRAAIGYLER